MRAENSIALKEWAAVCLALAEGRQSLLLRKGGIAESAGGFRFEHDEFWLLPTQFHQSSDQLVDDAREMIPRVEAQAPPPGRLLLGVYAVVRAVAFVEDESRLAELTHSHVLSADVVRQRFHYRRPGLLVAAVEVFTRPEKVDVVELARYAGCHSWVELDHPISTTGATPVIADQSTASAVRLVELLGGNPVQS